MQGPRVPLGNVIFSGQVKGRRCSIHINGPDYGGESIIITLCIWLQVSLLLISAWATSRVDTQKRAQDKRRLSAEMLQSYSRCGKERNTAIIDNDDDDDDDDITSDREQLVNKSSSAGVEPISTKLLVRRLMATVAEEYLVVIRPALAPLTPQQPFS